jgi:isopentenyl-diphosphate delta-isomerase
MHCIQGNCKKWITFDLMKNQEVILVNEQDEAIGVLDKMEAHRKGLLHRAFSVFIFDAKGRMLLQQRAKEKYHGGLLWTNACCSHPYPGEDVQLAAERRLHEELGFSVSLHKIFEFTYRAAVENELTEYEFDHVFAGEYDGKIGADPREVADVEYRQMEEIRSALNASPESFTSWFKIAFPKIEQWWTEKYQQVLKNK